jgi:hypothetical protein
VKAEVVLVAILSGLVNILLVVEIICLRRALARERQLHELRATAIETALAILKART